MERNGGERTGLFQVSTKDGNGMHRSGEERKGFPSCVHIGMDRSGVDRIGMERKGLERTGLFHASTKDGMGTDRTGLDRRVFQTSGGER